MKIDFEDAIDNALENAAEKYVRENNLPAEKTQELKDQLWESWRHMTKQVHPSKVRPPSSPQEQLERFDSADIPGVRILSQRDSDVCHACRQLDGRKYTIEEALKEQPLPHDECENDRCRCTYSPLSDAPDRRISKYEAVAQKWSEIGEGKAIVLAGLKENDIQNLRALLHRRFGKEDVIVDFAEQYDGTCKAVVKSPKGSKYLRDGS